ncbi:MAG: DUF58 domain-containing protein [Gammaproteobacteria bacterium]|nr:DUF58 domain-containing protein [Gammaproteobacteria bacterium]NIR97860.1 DUF58 domain-containing protein [Gammaproteobacteria bacterium]NIT63565.1 DUF58 domain-containing protein [Gammaproteobacteria bacterium]NIV20501.1 DUF58 domain-containing protein [Gammaproteobacteria bacterium]NIX11095.1 DUF58 domain-containing protein [Gammaproteobacteria bacterium]
MTELRSPAPGPAATGVGARAEHIGWPTGRGRSSSPGPAERLSTRGLHGPEAEPVLLTRRRIFILPTRHGVLFAGVLLVMLLGSINYNNNMGHALTFLLGALALVSILHTYRNLAHIQIYSARAEPVFAGQTARFPIFLQARRPPYRCAVRVQGPDQRAETTDVPFMAGTRAELRVGVPAEERGVARAGRLKLFTEYPLGLFRAWAWVQPAATGLVYPRPEPGLPPVTGEDPEPGEAVHDRHPGTEDFRGLRDYRPGDSPRHIAWKQMAATGEMLTKQFGGGAQRTLWLDWRALDGLGVEARLSRLCRWVLDSHGAGHRYGLRLPDQVIEPASGDQQRQRCLSALALFQTGAMDPTAAREPGEHP